MRRGVDLELSHPRSGRREGIEDDGRNRRDFVGKRLRCHHTTAGKARRRLDGSCRDMKRRAGSIASMDGHPIL